MIKKTVTPRKVTANQNNGKDSTGPRTEWGKFNSRFNAVKDGLFAMEVVIPDCDGDDVRRRFSELLQNLLQEFEPVGAFQTALVEKIAEGLWRLRRATRAEYGATRVAEEAALRMLAAAGGVEVLDKAIRGEVGEPASGDAEDPTNNWTLKLLCASMADKSITYKMPHPHLNIPGVPDVDPQATPRPQIKKTMRDAT